MCSSDLQPPDTHISPAPEREGEGRARPEDVPPLGFLRLAAGGESALPASLPSRPRTPTQTADRAFCGEPPRQRAAHLPARLPDRRSQLRPEAAGSPGCTADTRAPPSGLPAPSAPLRRQQTAPPGQLRRGKRKRLETSRQSGPTGRPKGLCVCPHASEAVSPSLRRALGSSHLRTAPGRHRGCPDAVTARGLCCAAA